MFFLEASNDTAFYGFTSIDESGHLNIHGNFILPDSIGRTTYSSLFNHNHTGYLFIIKLSNARKYTWVDICKTQTLWHKSSNCRWWITKQQQDYRSFIVLNKIIVIRSLRINSISQRLTRLLQHHEFCYLIHYEYEQNKSICVYSYCYLFIIFMHPYMWFKDYRHFHESYEWHLIYRCLPLRYDW